MRSQRVRSRASKAGWSRLRAPVVLSVLVLLGLGHWLWHYKPRVRVAAPGRETEASAVFDDRTFEHRLWLAYPHQNLARLLQVTDRPVEGASGSALNALFELLGADDEPVSLPSFGPFAVPPSSEMAVAWQGDRLRVSARVYPGVALIGRLAGLVARNPWLAGGDVRSSGRSGVVHWSGRSWSYDSPPLELPRGREGELAASLTAGSERPGEALARFAVGSKTGPLEAGQYRVEQIDDTAFQFVPEALGDPSGRPKGVVLPRFDELPPATQWPLPSLDAGAVALVVDGRGGMLEGRSTLLIVEQPILGGSLQLPRSVALAEGSVLAGGDGDEAQEDDNEAESANQTAGRLEASSERFSLPGEDLARRLQVDLREGEHAGWSIFAMDRRSRSLGSRIVPTVEELLQEGDEEISFGVWLRPEPLHAITSSLSRALDSVPFVSKRDQKRWRDFEVLTAALLPYRRVIVLVYERGGVEIRLIG